jgi:hypothetical protein
MMKHALNVLHQVEVVLLLCKHSVNGCLLCPSQWGEISGVGTGVVCRRAQIVRSTKRVDGEERVYRAQHNQALPPKVGAFGAWETL